MVWCLPMQGWWLDERVSGPSFTFHLPPRHAQFISFLCRPHIFIRQQRCNRATILRTTPLPLETKPERASNRARSSVSQNAARAIHLARSPRLLHSQLPLPQPFRLGKDLYRHRRVRSARAHARRSSAERPACGGQREDGRWQPGRAPARTCTFENASANTGRCARSAG